jgi:hypothetical protein
MSNGDRSFLTPKGLPTAIHLASQSPNGGMAPSRHERRPFHASVIRCYRALFSGREALDRGTACVGVGAERLAVPARVHIWGQGGLRKLT